MKSVNSLSDEAVLKELGERIAQHRLNQNKTQVVLAQEAGISHRTMARAEHGESVQASSLIRILRALQLLGSLDMLIPVPVASPLQQLKLQGKRRQRASSQPETLDDQEPWSWGDES